MNVEFSTEEINIIEKLLEREVSTLSVEVRHAVIRDFKDFLKDQERIVTGMLDRIRKISKAA